MDVYVNCETIPQEFLVSSVACFFVFAFERRLHMVSDILSHSIALALPIIQFPCSFFNLSVTSPTSQIILQPFRRFTYVTALILQPFRHFTYVTTHSPTLPSLYLRHSPVSNPSVASPTSQFILQPFFRFSYVTSSSLNSPGEPPMLHNTHFVTLKSSSTSAQKSFKIFFRYSKYLH